MAIAALQQSLRMTSSLPLCIALAGGNALGAYAAGALDAIERQGLQPSVLSGSSIGAVLSVLFAGNPPATRLARLRAFWQQASSGGGLPGLALGPPRTAANLAHALHTLAFGRPGLFHPSGPSWWPGGTRRSLFDHRELESTLHRLVDFDHLHEHGPRVLIHAVDLHDGTPVVFDSRRERITPRHVLASTGLLPCFPPVEIDGRLLVDPGLFCNLPLDPLLAADPADRVCVAVDLFSAEGPVPRTLDDALERAQDIAFSSQTTRTLAAFQREQTLRHALQRAQAAQAVASRSDTPAPVGHVDLLVAAYSPPDHELGAKTLEFSERSIRERWQAGRDDLERLLQRLERREPDEQDLGWTLYRQGLSRPMRAYTATMGPAP